MSKKILIFGANGLVGSFLTEKLSENNLVFANVRSENINFKINSNIKLIKQDLNNLDLDSLPSKIDAVFYLAQSKNYKDFPNYAQEIFNINTLIPFKIIQWAIKNNVKKFIYTSTGGIYNSNSNKYTEYSIINANQDINFYLSSKLSAELILKNYSNYFDTFVILRPFFIYGPRQNLNMLIPTLIRKIQTKEEILLEGSKGIKINPIYVKDASTAIANTLKLKGKYIINIAGNEIISLKDLIFKIASILKIEPIIKTTKTRNLNLIGDNSLMRTKLHDPQITLEEGLKYTISFYKKEK